MAYGSFFARQDWVIKLENKLNEAIDEGLSGELIRCGACSRLGSSTLSPFDKRDFMAFLNKEADAAVAACKLGMDGDGKKEELKSIPPTEPMSEDELLVTQESKISAPKPTSAINIPNLDFTLLREQSSAIIKITARSI